jgi:acyl-CoA thioester hydrolase
VRALSAERRFEMPLVPEPADIDELGHVNNIVYVRWIQELAAAHWCSITSAAERGEVAWVVMRHEIDYKAGAYLGDALAGRTWVGEQSAATCVRHTEIARADDGRLLMAAQTTWCAIHPADGRLRRIPDAIRARFTP